MASPAPEAPLRAAVFDLDGTLVDSLEDLADATNAVLERQGFAVHPVDAYRYFVGDGVEALVRRALPPVGDEIRERCVAAVRAEYATRYARKTRPYPGVPGALAGLARRGIPAAVLSNKPHDATVEVVGQLLPGPFAAVEGARRGVPKKPDPVGALTIARRLGIPPRDFAYVGDTAVDMRTAVSAGMLPLGALWGFRTGEELRAAGARHLLADPREVLRFFPESCR